MGHSFYAGHTTQRRAWVLTHYAADLPDKDGVYQFSDAGWLSSDLLVATKAAQLHCNFQRLCAQEVAACLGAQRRQRALVVGLLRQRSQR